MIPVNRQGEVWVFAEQEDGRNGRGEVADQHVEPLEDRLVVVEKR